MQMACAEDGSRKVRLKLSAAIRNEWAVRCIGDVVPALASIDYDQPEIEVGELAAREIAADCRFYIDPQAVDATAGERSAYRALLQQIEAALAAGCAA
jgi:hypothetical protein